MNRLRLLAPAAAAAVTLCAAGTFAPAAYAAGPVISDTCAVHENLADTIADVQLHCNDVEFYQLFTALDAGVLPAGKVTTDGYIRIVGINGNPYVTDLANTFWAGKRFDTNDTQGIVHNLVFGHEAVPGDIYVAPSVLDGKPAIWVDYAASGLPIFHDELRYVQDGLYLGYGFGGPIPSIPFFVVVS